MTTDIPSCDDITTITADRLVCPVCATLFQRVRRQRFCSARCRKIAWARTHQSDPRPAEPVPPPGRRRAATVYCCGTCETRYFGQQWCHECNTPAARIGYGGLCPHCDEPVALIDLLGTQGEPSGR